MTTLKSGFKYSWLIALSLALFSCAQTNIERDASNENGASAERSQQGSASRSNWWWKGGLQNRLY